MTLSGPERSNSTKSASPFRRAGRPTAQASRLCYPRLNHTWGQDDLPPLWEQSIPLKKAKAEAPLTAAVRQAAILIMRSVAVCKAPAAAHRYTESLGVVRACCGWSGRHALLVKMRTDGTVPNPKATSSDRSFPERLLTGLQPRRIGSAARIERIAIALFIDRGFGYAQSTPSSLVASSVTSASNTWINT